MNLKFTTLLIILFFIQSCKEDTYINSKENRKVEELIQKLKYEEKRDLSNYLTISSQLKTYKTNEKAQIYSEYAKLNANYYAYARVEDFKNLENFYEKIIDKPEYESLKAEIDVKLIRTYTFLEMYNEIFNRLAKSKNYLLNQKYNFQRKLIINGLTSYRLNEKNVNFEENEKNILLSIEEFKKTPWIESKIYLHYDLVFNYAKKGEFEKALKHLLFLISENNKSNIISDNIYCYYILSLFEKDRVKSLNYMEKSIQLALQTGCTSDIDAIYLNNAGREFNRGNLKEALNLFEKAYKAELKYKGKEVSTNILAYKAWTLYNINPKKNLSKAVTILSNNLEKPDLEDMEKQENLERIVWCLEGSKKNLEAKPYRDELEQLLKVQEISEHNKNIITVQNLINFEFTDYNIKFLENQEIINEEKNTRLKLYLIFGTLLFISSIIIAYYYRNRFLLLQDIDNKNNLIKHQLAEQKKLNSKLQNSNNDLKNFARIAAHDFKSPLANINFIATNLKNKLEGNLKNQESENLNYLISETNNLKETVHNLLNFYTVTENLSKPISIDLNELVNEFYKNSTLLLNQKNTILVNCENLPTITAHVSLIKLLLNNILNNCLKYGKKEVPIEISINYTKLKNFYSFKITDNGIGIDEKMHKKVFQIFTKGHQLNIEGSGIGLSLCKRIVEFYQGTIRIESEIDIGTSVIFTLPIH